MPLVAQFVGMYGDILVPTDGSESSTAAVEHAVALAERTGATVHFLHVIDVGTEMSASGLGTIAPELTETLEQEGETALDDAVTAAETADVEHERLVEEGVPHETIVTYSSDRPVDLIVMGASGRSGLAEHLLGSTTDRVVRSVDVSVLLARPEE